MKIQIGNNITFNIKNNQIDDVKSVSCVLRYSAIPNNSSLYTLNNCNSEYYNALPQNLSMREYPALKDGDVITLNSEYDEDTKTISCIFPKEDLHQVGSYQLVVVLYCDDLNYKYVYEDTLQLYAKYTEFNEDVVINIVGTFSKIETVISSLQDLVDILFNEETGVIYELRREKLAISDYNIMQVAESLIYYEVYGSGNIIYCDPGYPATWIPNNGTWNETKGSLFSHEGEWRVVTENYPDDLLFTATFGNLWEFFYLNSKPLGVESASNIQVIKGVTGESFDINNNSFYVRDNGQLIPEVRRIIKDDVDYLIFNVKTTLDYSSLNYWVYKISNDVATFYTRFCDDQDDIKAAPNWILREFGRYNLVTETIDGLMRATDKTTLNKLADIPLSLGAGASSVIQGDANKATGTKSTAFGNHNQALGTNSFVEGGNIRDYDPNSTHSGNIASGYSSHAEGGNNKASGNFSHAEGNANLAEGNSSHAEGFVNRAYGNNSHAEGYNTVALNSEEHAQGKWNKSNLNTIHSVGIGSSNSDRINAQEVMNNGDHYIIGVGNYNGTNPNDSDTLQEVIVSVERGILLANNEIELINLNLETVVTPTLAGLLPEVVEITKHGPIYTTTANYKKVSEHVLNGGHAMFRYNGDEYYCIPISYVNMSVAGQGVIGLCGQVYISPASGRIAHVSIFWSSSGTLSITKA